MGQDPGLNPVVNRTAQPYPELRNLFELFGPFTNDVRLDPHAMLPVDFNTLKKAYEGRNEYLSMTIIHGIQDLATWPTQIMPLEYKEQTNFVVPIYTFPKVVAQQSAPEAPPELSTTVFENRPFSMVVYSTGFKIDGMFWKTPLGKQEGIGKMQNIIVALQLAMNRSVILALLYGKYYYQNFFRKYLSNPHGTYMDSESWRILSTFAPQKDGLTGWGFVYDYMRDAIKQDGGGMPTDWIVADGITIPLANLAADANTYSRSGEAINKYVNNGMDALNELRNIQINVWRPEYVANEEEPIQPLIQKGVFGDHFIHAAYTHDTVKPEDYNTAQRNIRVLDMDERMLVTADLEDAENHCMRWGDDGLLADVHWEYVKNVEENHKRFTLNMPNDGNVDLMYYRDDSGNYHVATALGDIEFSNLENKVIHHCAETRFNKVRPFGERFVKTIEDGITLRDTLYKVDPNELTNAAFIAAHYLMNAENVNQGTGLVSGNAFGGTNLPTIVRNANGNYVLQTLDSDGNPAFLAGRVGGFTLTDDATAANVVESPVPFTPVGYGSIPQLMTLAQLGNSTKGSLSRLGYDDMTIERAKAFIEELKRLYNISMQGFGKDHVAFRSAEEDLPDFFRSGNEGNEKFVMWAENLLCSPRYPFYLRPGNMFVAGVLTEEGQNLGAAPEGTNLEGFDFDNELFQQAFAQFVDDVRDFQEDLVDLRGFIQNIVSSNRQFALFVKAANESGILGDSEFVEFYTGEEMQNRRENNPRAYVKALKTILNSVSGRLEDINCDALGRPEWVCTRLSITYDAWLNSDTWNNGNPRIRPRRVYCPYEMFNGNQTEFINTTDGSLRDPAVDDVLALYFINPSLSSTGMTVDDDDDMYDDESENIIVDDKLFTGRTLSYNLQERFKNVATIQCLIRRMFARMTLFANPSKETFELMRENGSTYPVEYLNMRVNKRYITAWAILVRRGDVGRIFWTSSDFDFGKNVGNKDFVANYQIYYVAGVTDVRQYAIWKDMWCKQYIDGENMSYFDMREFNPEKKEFPKSVFCIMIPFDSYKKKRVKNPNTILGRFNKAYFHPKQQESISNINYGAYTYPSAYYTLAVTGINEIAQEAFFYHTRQEISDSSEWPINVETLQTYVEHYNPATNNYGGQGAVIENTDVFGTFYDGCASKRAEGGLFCSARYQTVRVV